MKRARLTMQRGLSPEEEERGMLFLGHDTFPESLPSAADCPMLFVETDHEMLGAAADELSTSGAGHKAAAELPQHAVWLAHGLPAHQTPQEHLLPGKPPLPASNRAAEGELPDEAMQHEIEQSGGQMQDASEVHDEAMQHDPEVPDQAMQHESGLPGEAAPAESSLLGYKAAQQTLAEPVSAGITLQLYTCDLLTNCLAVFKLKALLQSQWGSSLAGCKAQRGL